jgi:methylmalonyl-CoA/ethylmalonyl-CoA epimerase
VADKQPITKLPPIEHVGIVVKDVQKAMESYSSVLGWGPFEAFEIEMKNFTYRGRPGDARLKVALSQGGAVQLDLIEVLEGETPYSDFLREKGEGLQHLCCAAVDDLDRVLADLAEEGIEAVYHGDLPDLGLRVAYVSGDKTEGVMIELYEVMGARE